MSSKTLETPFAVVFTMSRNSWLLSNLPCQRYTDSTCGTILTHAATPCSTRPWAIFLASSREPTVLRTIRVLVIGLLTFFIILKPDACFDHLCKPKKRQLQLSGVWA